MRRNWDEDPDDIPGGDGVHVDVRELDDRVVVIVDLPGIEDPDTIDLRSDGRLLGFRVASDRQSYEDRVELPVRVDEESAAATYNNGVLEVTFARADGARAEN